MVLINIRQVLKNKLDSLKEYPKESYGDVIEQLIEINNNFIGITTQGHSDTKEGSNVLQQETEVVDKLIQEAEKYA